MPLLSRNEFRAAPHVEATIPSLAAIAPPTHTHRPWTRLATKTPPPLPGSWCQAPAALGVGFSRPGGATWPLNRSSRLPAERIGTPWTKDGTEEMQHRTADGQLTQKGTDSPAQSFGEKRFFPRVRQSLAG